MKKIVFILMLGLAVGCSSHINKNNVIDREVNKIESKIISKIYSEKPIWDINIEGFIPLTSVYIYKDEIQKISFEINESSSNHYRKCSIYFYNDTPVLIEEKIDYEYKDIYYGYDKHNQMKGAVMKGKVSIDDRIYVKDWNDFTIDVKSFSINKREYNKKSKEEYDKIITLVLNELNSKK